MDRFTRSTTYWHSLDDGRVQCDVCPRACKLRDGQQGVCFVRARDGDGIVLTTYGRSSGFCVDPIEKKPLDHFLPGSAVFSFGTAGCNLACRFCQNWDISKSKEIDTLADEASPETIARTAAELGCRSVAFTYNDPTIFLEYAIDVADACHDLGLAAVAVTAGLHLPGATGRVLRPPRRRQRRPEGVHRGLLPPHVRQRAGRRARHARVPAARDRRVVRADHAAHPRPERLRRRARCDDALGGRAPRSRRADALHGVPPRLPDARSPADTTGNARQGPDDRDRQRRALRLHGQRPRRRRSEHLVPRLRCGGDRA